MCQSPEVEAPGSRSGKTFVRKLSNSAHWPCAASRAVGRVRDDAASPHGAGVGGVASSGRSAAAGPSQPVDPGSYLAYSYGISVEIPGDRLIGVMERHAAACRGAGLRVCQLVASRREGDPQETLRGSLSLRAEPQWLQGFMKGVQRDRLQHLLATRPGSLTDLLGAERELARVQGEIDSTGSNLAGMRTRVAMSALTIEYQSSARVTASGTFAPLRDALGDFAVAVVESSASLVVTLGTLLPWAIAGVFGVWLLVRAGRRRVRRAVRPGSTPAPS